MYVFTCYPAPRLYIPTKNKFTWCSHLKYFQMIFSYNFLSSLFSLFMFTVQQPNGSACPTEQRTCKQLHRHFWKHGMWPPPRTVICYHTVVDQCIYCPIDDSSDVIQPHSCRKKFSTQIMCLILNILLENLFSCVIIMAQLIYCI
jgi:hypothetical protein